MDIEKLKHFFTQTPSNTLPIYVCLANYFRLQIQSGELDVGEKMIGEEEICKILGISRTTVRQSMNMLVEEGLLIRYRGKGTFVSRKKYNRAINHLYNFSSDMESMGYTPSSRILSQEILNVKDSAIHTILQMPANQTDVFHLVRVRQADHQPVLVENTYIPHYLCRGIEFYDFDQLSLYEVLKNTYNLYPFSAVEQLQGILIPKYERNLLRCPPNTVGYKIKRIARLDSNFIYEYTSSITRADICTYEFQLCAATASKSNSVIVLNEESM